ncbi:MAG: peroxide stress protein YaaA, partial [Armatimonadota bacterium]
KGNPTAALGVLRLTPGQLELLTVNSQLLRSPCGPAFQVYTGVLYSELNPASLSAEQLAKLDASVWIASALFGFVGFSDYIPAYRMSGDVTLPEIGSLTQYWKQDLSAMLDKVPGPIVDFRSGTYVKLGPLSKDVCARTVVPRVLQRMPDGPPKLITHFNKATKGRLMRAYALSHDDVKSLEDFAALVRTTGADADLIPPTAAEKPWTMDIIVGAP